MFVPLNNENLSMIEKDNTVHTIFSWKEKKKNHWVCFSRFCLKLSQSSSWSLRNSPHFPPPFEETNSQSKPTFLPKCELYSLCFYFFLRFKASGEDSLEQPSEIRTVPWRISVRRGCYLFALPAILPLSPGGIKPGWFCLMLIKSLC